MKSAYSLALLLILLSSNYEAPEEIGKPDRLSSGGGRAIEYVERMPN